jgi:hypothetical protein
MLKNMIIALFFVITAFSVQASERQELVTTSEEVIQILSPKCEEL